jgi:hypothetical protein
MLMRQARHDPNKSQPVRVTCMDEVGGPWGHPASPPLPRTCPQLVASAGWVNGSMLCTAGAHLNVQKSHARGNEHLHCSKHQLMERRCITAD